MSLFEGVNRSKGLYENNSKVMENFSNAKIKIDMDSLKRDVQRFLSKRYGNDDLMFEINALQREIQLMKM